ncbi:hypothetical protein KIH39_09010 [Telmatocola sphagniphila]|uniref:Uncharacterized protein n=1 Tax=Telmatocola sphagniphila TaxID=1123043 RepID=A0A8E6EWQ2_9BACT|nr:hypothetical protein [Telmatocola sphagniphila]QVL34027.1 hypothetical protein KIH39_09010 [Telmatocola sphagniphila]
MRTFYFLILLATPTMAGASDITEIKIEEIDEQICLRSDGTATYSFRGHSNRNWHDERVGLFEAKLDPREFNRLTRLPGAIRFDDLKGHYLPYSTRVVRTTVVRHDKLKTLERHDRSLTTDPEPPTDLWDLEMAVRGLASQIKWERVPQGLKVNLSEGSVNDRQVLVREAGTNIPVGFVLSDRREIVVSTAPGNYFVEVSESESGKSKDLSKHLISIKEGKYTPLKIDLRKTSGIGASQPLEEFVIQSPNCWWLRCAADGSGIMGFGTALANSTEFSAGTIDFTGVVAALRKTESDQAFGSRFFISYLSKGSAVLTLYSKDGLLVKGLFAKAAEKTRSSNRGSHFDQVWASKPPDLEK